MCNEFGLLSGKYDSTKQRAVLLQGDRLRNYRRYNATIRMEMLIAGGIIVTDAQFYDGLYFAWMTDDRNQFTEFINCVSNFYNKEKRKIFKIMQREIDYNKLSTKMFCKQFYFSSLESKELANFVNEIGEDYTISLPDDSKETQNVISDTQNYIEELKGKGKDNVNITKSSNTLQATEENLSDYLTYMKNNIKCNYGNIYDEEWENFSGRITRLFESIENTPLVEKWIDNNNRDYRGFIYKNYLSESFDSGKNNYYSKMADTLKEFKNIMSDVKLSNKYFTLIKTEALKSFPTRSTIVNYFNKIFQLAAGNISDDKMEKAEECRLKYIKLFNDRYNKAIAYQHRAKFIDVCDYNENVAEIINNNKGDFKFFSTYISDDTIETLGKMTWEDFYCIISDEKIISSYNAFCDSYNKETDSCDDFKTIFDDYIALLEEEIKKIAIINNENVNEGPWNYHYTNKYKLFEKFFTGVKPSSFVGGGSYIEGEEANEICLFRDCGQNSLYSLRINNNSVNGDNCTNNDNKFNTVIAPVNNIFNGKVVVK